MTGSGKTGLGVTLLEEAAIDGIPALVVDPKGDMTNLLLNFPSLQPSDFAPWINADDARREGVTPEEFAARQAATLAERNFGLASNGRADSQTGRVVRLQHFHSRQRRRHSDFDPLVVRGTATVGDGGCGSVADRISTTATSLLALLGIDADPIRSREHILLTTILDHCWRNRQSLDIGSLIQMVQSPPVQKIGVMDLESFYPAKDRFDLAMSLNNCWRRQVSRRG